MHNLIVCAHFMSENVYECVHIFVSERTPLHLGCMNFEQRNVLALFDVENGIQLYSLGLQHSFTCRVNTLLIWLGQLEFRPKSSTRGRKHTHRPAALIPAGHGLAKSD